MFLKCHVQYTACSNKYKISFCTWINVEVRLDQAETRSEKAGRGVRQGSCLSPIVFNLFSEYLTKEALERSGDLKIEGQVIRTVKYANDLVLLAEEESVTGHD